MQLIICMSDIPFSKPPPWRDDILLFCAFLLSSANRTLDFDRPTSTIRNSTGLWATWKQGPVLLLLLCIHSSAGCMTQSQWPMCICWTDASQILRENAREEYRSLLAPKSIIMWANHLTPLKLYTRTTLHVAQEDHLWVTQETSLRLNETTLMRQLKFEEDILWRISGTEGNYFLGHPVFS